MAVHPNQLVHFSGGECLEKYGTLVKSPVLPVRQLKPTFTRSHASSAVSGLYTRGKNGVLVAAEADTPRVVHLDLDDDDTFESLALRLEGAGTNLLSKSEEIDHTDWTKNNVSVSADAATAPDGNNTADKIVGDATTGPMWVLQTESVSSGADYTLSIYVTPVEWSWVQITGSTGFPSTWLNFNASTGETGNGDATRFSVEKSRLGNWYRISLTLTASSTEAGGRFIVAFYNFDVSSRLANMTGDGSKGIAVWGAQFEQASVPSTYIPTTTANVTRNAETFSVPFGAAPQELTIYSDLIDLHGSAAGLATAARRIARIGSGTKRADLLWGAGTVVRGIFQAAAASDKSLTTTVAAGDRVEQRMVIQSNGSVTVGYSLNSAAEVTGTGSGSEAPGTIDEWGTPTIYLGATDTGTNHGFLALRSLKVALGTHSMSAMRAAY